MPAAGTTVPLESTWTNGETGLFTDPSALSVAVYSGSTIVSGPFTSMTKLSTGHYVYEYTIPTTLSGDYVVQWTATINGSVVIASEALEVQPSTTLTTINGVTVNDVANLTGVAVSASVLAQAVSVVETFASVDLSNFRAFGARNRFWLQKAIAYQAAWMASQVGYMGRSDFQSQSQDGMSFTTRDDTDVLLAPLALRALQKVSWNRPRAVRVMPSRRLNPNHTEPFERAPNLPITDAVFDYPQNWI